MTVILENKVRKKLKMSKNYSNKKCASKLIFFNEKNKIRKIRIIFEVKTLTLKVKLSPFSTTFKSFMQVYIRPKKIIEQYFGL